MNDFVMRFVTFYLSISMYYCTVYSEIQAESVLNKISSLVSVVFQLHRLSIQYLEV